MGQDGIGWDEMGKGADVIVECEEGVFRAWDRCDALQSIIQLVAVKLE